MEGLASVQRLRALLERMRNVENKQCVSFSLFLLPVVDPTKGSTDSRGRGHPALGHSQRIDCIHREGGFIGRGVALRHVTFLSLQPIQAVPEGLSSPTDYSLRHGVIKAALSGQR